MKDHIPIESKQTSIIKKYESTFKKKDIEIINKFLVYCGGTAGERTLNKIKRFMYKICDVLEGDLDKITLEEMREFLQLVKYSELSPATKNDIRKIFKRFLKETYSDWSSRFKNLEDPSLKSEPEINQDKINGNTILRKEEIERLMRKITSLKYKAVIMLMYETAGRPEEILKLKFKDVNLTNGDVKLKSSKTGNLRINPIQNSVIHIERWVQEYPFQNKTADDFLFPNPKKRNEHQSLVAFGIYLKRKSVEILNRPIFPYLLRHTRATELQKVLPAKIYEKFMDHSIETATRYSHLNKTDVREAMFKNVYKVDEISEEDKNKLEKEVENLKTLNNLQGRINTISLKKMTGQKLTDEDKQEVVNLLNEIQRIQKKEGSYELVNK